MDKLFGGSAMLTTAQVAKRENVTPRAIQIHCKNGTLYPVRRYGRAWLVGEGYYFIQKKTKDLSRVTESGRLRVIP